MQALSDKKPLIMAVINLTPDSFSDGGRFVRDTNVAVDAALKAIGQALDDGADLIDLGGESTRPGAAKVSVEAEKHRVLPVLAAVKKTFPEAAISIDTSSPDLMLAAAEYGIAMINDVRALTRPGAVDAAAQAACAVCLMHMQGSPEDMQQAPTYQQVVSDVMGYLSERKAACLRAGIPENRICVDPGIGFGKKDEHNLALIKAIPELKAIGPVLLGVSRKSMFGRLLGREVDDRLAGSLAVAYDALSRGVDILRVHDVAQTRDVVKMFGFLND